jgi:hypothetical protein
VFNSAILEVVIGIVFVFVLVSTLCAAVREGIESVLKTRASYLEHAIRELLHDRDGQGLSKSFFGHPMIHGLFLGEYAPKEGKPPRPWRGGGNLPSYIPARSFALAVMDLAARGPDSDAPSGAAAPGMLAAMRNGVDKLGNLQVRRAVLAAIDDAQGDIEKARQNIEAWFDGTMDRISGTYKRHTQWVLAATAISIAIGFNIDTIAICDALYRDGALRSAVIASADNAAVTKAPLTYEQASAQLDGLRMPIGWDRAGAAPDSAAAFFRALLGWLITAFAATLGAPFWFDVLNKVMVIRATVKPREKSREEGSEDRADPAQKRSAAQPTEIIIRVRPDAVGQSSLPPSGEAADGGNGRLS